MARRWLEHHGAAVLAVRAVSPLTIVAVTLATYTCLLLEWAWLFPQPWLGALAGASHFVIQLTLVGGIAKLAVTLAVACGLGRLRASDLGLRLHQLRSGIAWTVGIWVVAQIALALSAVVAGDGLALDPAWEDPARATGGIIAQVFGTAVSEEVLDRGFLLVQCVLLAQRMTTPRRGWAIGLVVSQVLFALGHIPQRWIVGDIHGASLLENLTGTFVFGIELSIVYVRTGNLFIAMGFHALNNAPSPVFGSPLRADNAVSLVMLAVVLAWPYLRTAERRT